MPELQRDVRFIADQVYSNVAGSPRLADVYLPTSTSERLPVVVWLHGGGWRFGDRRLAPDLRAYERDDGIAQRERRDAEGRERLIARREHQRLERGRVRRRVDDGDLMTQEDRWDALLLCEALRSVDRNESE